MGYATSNYLVRLSSEIRPFLAYGNGVASMIFSQKRRKCCERQWLLTDDSFLVSARCFSTH